MKTTHVNMNQDGASEWFLGPMGITTSQEGELIFTSDRTMAALTMSYNAKGNRLQLGIHDQSFKYKDLCDLIDVLKEVKTDWKEYRDNARSAGL